MKGLQQTWEPLKLTLVQPAIAATAATAAAVGGCQLLLQPAAEVVCCRPDQGFEAGVLAAGTDLQATFHGSDG
jgi:hypothetical protein